MKKIGWYDIKTKFKYLLRSIFYSGFIQSLACFIIANYLRLVFFSSKKIFHNFDEVNKFIKAGKPFIVASWHSRIALGYFVFYNTPKVNKDYKFTVLASAHGDGMIIGNVMKNFGLGLILGSTQKKSNPKRGITIGNFRQIFKSLKENSALCITPDGPRGPKFKVSGHTSSIAKMTQVPIFPISFGSARKKVFNSWDNFVLPLPFSKIAFCIGKKITVDKSSNNEELQQLNLKIEQAINEVTDESDRIAKS